jgi:hypothetical protein
MEAIPHLPPSAFMACSVKVLAINFIKAYFCATHFNERLDGEDSRPLFSSDNVGFVNEEK